ncbi:alanine racemase [Sphingomonas sp. MMS24-J13]|uniref:alanine racemase n=1 Tax=Sphingomonas sp. MMS24-J13 TaxID=3238686 RepID=UPI00384EB1C4
MDDGTEPNSRSLAMLETPCLILDAAKMRRNIARMAAHIAPFGVSLRPHLKTAKSIAVARAVMASPQGPATVSTLMEAEQFAAGGVRDIIYAVGVAPAKLDRVIALRRQGVDLAIILDTVEQAEAVAAASRAAGLRIPTLIEIDSDGHRGGVGPAEPDRIVAIGRILAGDAELRGVLTHAGESYGSRTPEQLRDWVEIERNAAVSAARTLRAAGLPCPVVSVGSTPTALGAVDMTGVTEVRAGVFVFFDLVMAGIGVCTVDEIALSVLATVVGHQREKGWILIDAGWMAMSQDRGTAKQAIDQGHGVVCDLLGRPYPDLIVSAANQEHGTVTIRPGSNATLPDLAIGDRVRILPNHACSTAAQHGRYHVVEGESDAVQAEWLRFGGW